MIIGIEGGLSAGKTLVMTWLIKQEYVELHKPVYANYHLRRIPYTPVDRASLIESMNSGYQFDQGEGAVIAIDEMHILADSRGAMSKMNRLMSYFILQSSKQGVNFYYTTQDLGQVDLRLRRRTDIAISVERQGDLHKCLVLDLTTPEPKPSRFAIDGSQVWDEYYTEEVIKIN